MNARIRGVKINTADLKVVEISQPPVVGTREA